MHYKGASGREGDWFRLGFAPRKGNMTIYFLCDMRRLGDSLAKLGKHSQLKVLRQRNRLHVRVDEGA